VAQQAPHLGGRGERPHIEIFAFLGSIFIAITFGVLFAGVYMTALTAMIDRLGLSINFMKSLLGL
jgi:hypothetical protein